jgi:hypothetical protein
MTERVSLFKVTQIPESFGAVLLIFFFILLLSPYFSGADFGIFKIPLFTDKAKRWFKIIGPILFVCCALSFLPLIPANSSTPQIDPNDVYDDTGKQEIFNNYKVHVCPLGYAMIGADAEGNIFRCRRVVTQDEERFVQTTVDTNTRREDMHACPKGMYMRGLHLVNDWLICSYNGKNGLNLEASEFQAMDAIREINVCTQSPNTLSYMVGIDIKSPINFLCGAVKQSSAH